MPRIALIYSVVDPAGTGAAGLLSDMLSCGEPRRVDDRLLELRECEGTVLAGFRDDVIYLDYIDAYMDGWEAYIFLSRHLSASGRPTLSIHHTGNPCGEAPYGGRPRSLSIAYPRLAKQLLTLYHERAAELGLLGEYQFTLEATHHGPTELAKPLVFIEVGSREEQWRDRRALEAMALAVRDVLAASSLPACSPVIGIGGTHYPEKHTRLMLSGEYCYGHIFAKYVLDCLDEDMLKLAVERSADLIEGFVVLKTRAAIRRLVERVAGELGLRVERYR